MPLSPKSRRARVAIGLVLVLAVLPACSNKKSSSAPKTTLPPTYPLTGLPPTDPATLDRGAIAVKIDNIAAARPQSGLDVADVVYEELAEGGLTRFVVVFQSTNAASVGPVRSARPSDANIVAPLNGALVYSGGAPAILQLVETTSGVKAVSIESVPGASSRRPGRSAPQNLYTSTALLYEKVGAGLRPPPKLNDFLQQGQQFTAAGAVPATSLNLRPGSAVTAGYNWDPATNTWKRSTDGRPHTVEGGAQVAATNVIVQFTPYAQWPHDSKVQVATTVGTGEAWILTAGMVVKGTWEKANPNAVTVFKDSAGAPIRLPPGRTWIELPPPGSPASTT